MDSQTLSDQLSRLESLWFNNPGLPACGTEISTLLDTY